MNTYVSKLYKECELLFINVQEMIKVFQNEMAFHVLTKEWTDLYSNSYFVTPFQSLTFNSLAWERHGEKNHLFIFIVLQSNTKLPLALFPCYVDGNHALRFINDEDCDFCSPLIRIGYEHNYALSEEISDFLINSKSFKRIKWVNLVGNSVVLSNFMPFMRCIVSYPINAFSYFYIHSSKDGVAYIDSINQIENAKDRNRLKKIGNKMKDANFIFYKKSNRETDYPSEIVTKLVDVMIKKGIRTKEYFNDQFLTFIKNMYERGILVIGVTFLKEEPVALSFSLIDNKKELIQWVALYLEKKYNLWNVLQLVNYLYEKGGNIRLNFARGIYEYKLRNFRPIIEPLYCFYYSKTKRGQVRDAIGACVYYLRKIDRLIV